MDHEAAEGQQEPGQCSGSQNMVVACGLDVRPTADLVKENGGPMGPAAASGGLGPDVNKWPAKGANGVTGNTVHVSMDCDPPQGNGCTKHAGRGEPTPQAPLAPAPDQAARAKQQQPKEAAVPQAADQSTGAEQTHHQQQQPAMAGGNMSTPQASGAAPHDDSAAAMAELEAILTRISQLDVEGWFQAPVSEADAPRYYTIIKQPMCFQVMRSKIRARQYVNWQEVVRDFELICTNAMKYNQKRSRIHKLALVMLRAGKKLLIEVETQGRKAIERLHPAGGAAAAAAAAAAATPLLGDGLLMSPALASTGGLTPRGDLTLTAGAGGLRSASVLDTAASGGLDPLLLEAPAAGAQAEGGYSSYDEETDLEDRDAASVPGLGKPGASEAFQLSTHAVLRQPWAAASGSRDLAAAAAAASASGQPLSREWRSARRGVEWRVRWLELRLRDLQHQRAHFQQQLAAAPEAPGVQQQQQAPPQPGSEQRRAKGAGSSDVCQPRPRQAVAELQLPQLLDHPFFAEHSGLGRQPTSKRQRTEGPPLQPGAAAAPAGESSASAAAAGAGGGDGLATTATAPPAVLPSSQPAAVEAEVSCVDDPDFGARAHAALDLLDRRLSSLRRQLVALQAPVGLGGVAAGGLARAAPGSARLGAANRGRPPSDRRGSSVRRADSVRSGEDYRSLKRRRAQEQELAELLPGILTLPKFVERTNRAIDTPRVRTLSAAEQKRRQAAVDALAASLKGNGKPDPKALAAIDALCPGESSGEEEITDAAFAARHAKLESEERTKYEAFAAAAVDGSRSTRNKNASSKLTAKEPRSKQQQQQQPASARAVQRTASAPAKLAAGAGISQGAPTPPGVTLASAAATPASAPAGPVAASPTPTPNGVAADASGTKQQQHKAPGSAPAVQALAPAAGPAKAAQPTPSAPPAPTPAVAAGPAAAKPTDTPPASQTATPAVTSATAGAAAASQAKAGSTAAMMYLPMNAQMAAQMAQAMAMAQVQVAAAKQAAENAGDSDGGAASSNAAAAAAAQQALMMSLMRPQFTPSAEPAAGGTQQSQQQGSADSNGFPAALQAIIPPEEQQQQQQQKAPSGSTSGRGRGRPSGGRSADRRRK